MNASLEIEGEARLAEAFATFTAAAGGLEASYQQLRMEVVRLRKELEERNAEIERQRESVRRLIALAEMSSVLAHEIRNPLGAMELFAGLLAGSADLSAESRRWVEEIQAGMRSLSATVNNVLRLHTLGPPVRVPIRLAPLLRGAAEFIRPLAEQAGVHLRLEESLGEAEVAGNRSELQQVILNLGLNAFRHMGPGGELKIKAGREEKPPRESAVVELSDTGCGIPPEHLPRIFEAGFTTSRQSPGLGLTICRKIVQQHEGALTVVSRVGQGTTFRIELPVL